MLARLAHVERDGHIRMERLYTLGVEPGAGLEAQPVPARHERRIRRKKIPAAAVSVGGALAKLDPPAVAGSIDSDCNAGGWTSAGRVEDVRREGAHGSRSFPSRSRAMAACSVAAT